MRNCKYRATGPRSHSESGDVFIKGWENKRSRLKACGYVCSNTHALFQHHRSCTIPDRPRGREHTSFSEYLRGGHWRDSFHSIFQPGKALNMKQKYPRALTNEPQQADVRAWIHGLPGGLISLAITQRKKACILLPPACFTHPWQLGFPMLHLGQCP